MGLSTQLEFIRSFLLRLQSLTRRKRRPHGRHTVGCVGRLRIPAVSTFRREELSDFSSDSGRKRQRSRRRKKKKLRFGLSFGNEVFVSPDAIPSEQEEFDNFTATHRGYLDTLVVDELREEEYGELQEEGHVCLDYSGYGLFSQLQQELDADSSSFAISHVSGDLSTQALYGEPEEGTVEYDIRRRIIRFLNIQEGEYSMVFTASKGSAFKILGESYPFNTYKSLLTVFDYESEAVCSLEEIARRRGAQIMNSSFNFPSFTLCSNELKSKILHRSGVSERSKKDAAAESKKQSWEDRWIKKKASDKGLLAETKKEEKEEEEAKGLFVFPVQSRITGTKYSYQWMSMAQDNGWHVLLDASALGPKDMDCLGLSLFRPDFIVTSFYKVFGSDPTGFGCLFVKNSTIDILRPSPEARSVGMVRLVADNSAFEAEGGHQIVVNGDEKHVLQQPVKDCSQLKQGLRHAEVAFSGPIAATWKTRSYCNRMEICLENVDSSPESPTAAYAEGVTISSGGHEKNANQDVNVNSAFLSKGKLQITGHGDQDKSIPLTPRSVLEETLIMDGQDQSMSHGSSSRAKPVLHSFEVGETSSKESVVSEWDSNPLLPIHKPQKAMEKKKLMAYYSQEITSHADPWMNAATAFSQPLGIKRNLSLAHSEGSSYYVGSQRDLDFSSSLYDDDDDFEDDDDEHSSEFDFEDDASIIRREPEIYCRGLNHADTLGLNKTNDRLRFLINWLISSMLKLQHHVSNKYVSLVHVYGPKVKYDRGASLAFNLFDHAGMMIKPVLVQQLADRHNISIGTGVLTHIRPPGNCAELQQNTEEDEIIDHSDSAPRFKVVTASLGFFTNFEDVYKLWAFLAKFLDTEFVRQESQILHQREAVLDCRNPT